MLVERSLDQSAAKLLPVRSLKDQVLVVLQLVVFEGLASLSLKIFNLLVGLFHGVLGRDFHSSKEIVESHGAVLLVLDLAEGSAAGQHLLLLFVSEGGLLEFILGFLFFLGSGNFSEGLDFLVIVEIKNLCPLIQLISIVAELDSDLV